MLTSLRSRNKKREAETTCPDNIKIEYRERKTGRAQSGGDRKSEKGKECTGGKMGKMIQIKERA